MKNFLRLIPMVLFVLAQNSAVAKEPSMTYLGALIGISSPGYTGGEATAGVGATFGRRLTPDFGVGAYWLQSKQNVVLTNITHSMYGVEGNYYFTGDMDGLSVGMRFGLATYSPGIGGSSTPLSIGPKMAFDYRITPAFSLGFDGGVLFQGSQNSRDGYSVVNMLGVVKLWF